MLSGANRRAPNIVHTTAFRAWIGAWSVRRSNCVHDELRESPYSKGSVRRDNRFRGTAVEVRAVSEGEAFNSHEEASEAARNEKRICN